MEVPVKEASAKPAAPSDEIQLVVFALAGCELAVGIKDVREILRVSDITPMPKAPKYIEGIINVRGRIFPVIDLKRRFDMPLVDKTDESRILVVEQKDQVLGLLVDKVVEVLKISPALIERVSAPVLTVGADFVGGLITLQNRLVILFNVGKIFTFEGLKAAPEVETAAGEGKNVGH